MREAQAIASQKFEVKTARASRGVAKVFPNMITELFIMYVFFSNLSPIIPPMREDVNPKMVRAIALINEYSFLN
jgi:hypothetical protein